MPALRCSTCGGPLPPRARKYCADCRPDPFRTDSAPYGTYDGRYGDPEDWAQAFHDRFADVLTLPDPDTAWSVLGLRPGASREDIKRAYRARAMATHPDVNPGADRAEFQRVQAAYETLYGVGR